LYIWYASFVAKVDAALVFTLAADCDRPDEWAWYAALLTYYRDIQKTRLCEQLRQVSSVPHRRQHYSQRVGACLGLCLATMVQELHLVWGADRDHRTPARAKHPVKLGQPSHWVGEEHQSEMAEHHIELHIGSRERLPILSRQRHIQPPNQTPAGAFEHSRRDVGRHNLPGRSDSNGGRACSDTGTRGNVEHALPGRDSRSPKQ
jgi:hypothetical protein